ncbi:MAG TPA: hypothetical protein VM182_06970 [Terriglobia bacterium]|nr:hypothetical protein [Terriglobia bacterium]
MRNGLAGHEERTSPALRGSHLRPQRRASQHAAAGSVTTHEEIRALDEMGMHAALAMAIYRRLFQELFLA